MKNPNRRPIKFCSFGVYRLFGVWWWVDLLWYLTGLRLYRKLWYGEREEWVPDWHLPGWLSDILTYWRRARYGWAPRDTWSLDDYLNNVLAGSLWHLAAHKNGVPGGYPGVEEDVDKAGEAWNADLKRWSTAFREAADGCDIYDAADGYVRHNAEEARIQTNLDQALKELIIWWRALWD